jgi:hypothetical protein
MTLQQNSLVTVTVDGRPLGTFDTRSGGAPTGAVTKHRSGGMGPIKQHKGLPDYEDVTVTRYYDRVRDHDLFRWLVTRASKGEMVVSDYVLDENGQRFGRPVTFLGVLMSVPPPDSDANSTDVKMLTLTMQTRSVA